MKSIQKGASMFKKEEIRKILKATWKIYVVGAVVLIIPYVCYYCFENVLTEKQFFIATTAIMLLGIVEGKNSKQVAKTPKEIYYDSLIFLWMIIMLISCPVSLVSLFLFWFYAYVIYYGYKFIAFTLFSTIKKIISS